MSKTDKLLVRAFCYKGVVAFSACDTDEGTRAQWNYLKRCGYVTKNTASGRGILGHDYCYAITDAGREYLANQVLREVVV
jgi:hypothetical protein